MRYFIAVSMLALSASVLSAPTPHPGPDFVLGSVTGSSVENNNGNSNVIGTGNSINFRDLADGVDGAPVVSGFTRSVKSAKGNLDPLPGTPHRVVNTVSNAATAPIKSRQIHLVRTNLIPSTALSNNIVNVGPDADLIDIDGPLITLPENLNVAPIVNPV